ncbi:MAG: hemin uptake protein HemP [Gemmataceae bacterium]|nr:hemin uptake protein HemP [Gemmataceae bacterium]
MGSDNDIASQEESDVDACERERTPNEPPRIVPAEELFAGRREVWIELSGARYRLRITRRGKLILQK